MKYSFVLLILFMFIISCNDLEISNPLHPDFVTKLNIDKSTQVIVPYTKGSFSIEVTSNVNWTVSSSESWLTYSPDSGSNFGTVTVYYTENVETAERNGTITITGNGVTRTCKVTQPPLFDIIFIPGGTFEMGSTGGDSDEEPVHTVTINAFYMSKYELTQELYQEVMGTNSSNWHGDNMPVERVTWYEAVEFCNALSQKVGLTPAYTISGTNVTWNQNANGYRLPTEAEWEYAAGGGSTNRTKWAGTNNESSLGIYAWYSSNSDNKTHPVGVKEPNSLGLYDMSGNVYEWCWDWYDSGYYSNSPSNNPTGPSTGSDRVLRGGSWGHYVTSCRVANRSYSSPSLRGDDVGFRLARNAE